MLERLSIRWRLALISAGLTCIILCAFAIAVGEATTNRIRSDFRNQLVAASDDLKGRLQITVNPDTGHVTRISPPLDAYAGAEHAVIRILNDLATLDRDVARTSEGLRGTFVLMVVVSGALLLISGLVLLARSRRPRRSLMPAG